MYRRSYANRTDVFPLPVALVPLGTGDHIEITLGDLDVVRLSHEVSYIGGNAECFGAL